MISFLHAADLHLGLRTTRFDPGTAERVREARFAALDNILMAARERQVDCLIIAGDLFDDSAVPHVTARRACEMLDSLPMPVYVLPGNHDPLLSGGVWDRDPWNKQPGKRLRLLDAESPLEIGPGVLLFPCPVFRKTSLNDPTRWIASANGGAADCIRIGVAHGSLRTRDDLPPDDHLIARHVADDLRLDYLALGHWHRRQQFADRAGIERTAYSGVHEPMGFPAAAEIPIGWIPYSGAGGGEFFDGGTGEVLHVSIAAAGQPPVIEPIEVRRLTWESEQRTVNTQDDLERLISDVATRPHVELRLLRLKLRGVLNAATMVRLDELRQILAHRYQVGDLDDAELHIEPTDDEIRAVAGEGVLHRVFETLRQEAAGDDAATRELAERGILLMYQIAREVQR